MGATRPRVAPSPVTDLSRGCARRWGGYEGRGQRFVAIATHSRASWPLLPDRRVVRRGSAPPFCQEPRPTNSRAVCWARGAQFPGAARRRRAAELRPRGRGAQTAPPDTTLPPRPHPRPLPLTWSELVGKVPGGARIHRAPGCRPKNGRPLVKMRAAAVVCGLFCAHAALAGPTGAGGCLLPGATRKWGTRRRVTLRSPPWPHQTPCT